MIETIDIAVQLQVGTVCLSISGCRILRSNRSRSWVLLSLFYGIFMLGDLYWILHLFFYGDTPQFTYISDICWYTAELFLFMLLNHVGDPKERLLRSHIPLICPVFAAGMALLYMQFGSMLNNLVSAIVMSVLLYQAVRGLVYHRKNRLHSKRCRLYALTLLFCMTEYALWTVSCFYWSDTLKNPYFWADFLQTACLPFFLPAVSAVIPADERRAAA